MSKDSASSIARAARPDSLHTLFGTAIDSGRVFVPRITNSIMCSKESNMPKVLFLSRTPRSLWPLILVFLFSVPVLFAAGVQDQPPAPEKAPASAVAPAASAHDGDAIFHKRCITCHNKQRDDDSPFGPPNLYTAFHGKPPLTTKAALNIITNGKDRMPAFGAVLTKSEILSVIAYLKRP
jgi:mono/diheme cytochrome c family protein